MFVALQIVVVVLATLPAEGAPGQPRSVAVQLAPDLWNRGGNRRATCGRRLVLADASATANAEQEQVLADIRAESMMLGPIPILWQFGSHIGR
jgi:hypothetical protein